MNRDEFKKYVNEWASKIQVSKNLKQIRLRKMKTKIASSSTRGILTFDPSVINKSKKEVDEIIVHELLHFRYPNHGKMFKLLSSIYLSNS